MKKILSFFMLIALTQTTAIAQTNMKFGLGIMTETVVYPGAVLEFEYEKMQTETISLPLRFDMGYYSHPRNHNVLFFDVHQGFRRYFNKGLVLENAVGVGIMFPFYNADVWEVDDNGNITSGKQSGGVDFMPSITLGIGYRMSKEKNNLIFFRPKIFWQFPFNGMALPHTAIQLGYVHTFKTNES